ncbi:hypothetical protein FQ187_27225 [Pseudomonas sp. ANT_J28]|nr:hypothetical protein FQ187_27225 [Pseudomonas sp. ANT_J28]
MPPPAPEPLFPALPPFPLPDEPDPLLPPLALWSLEGWPGLLLGAIVKPLTEPDWGPVASAPSPEAEKMPTDRADSTPASNSEVILMVIMVRLQDESLPDVGVKDRALASVRHDPFVAHDAFQYVHLQAFSASKGTRAIRAITGQRPSIGNGRVIGSSLAAMACVIQAPRPSMAAMFSKRSASARVKKHCERRIPIRQSIDRISAWI